MSCDRSIRRPLFFSGGLLVGALQVGYNQRVMDKCPAVHCIVLKIDPAGGMYWQAKRHKETGIALIPGVDEYEIVK